MAFHGYNLPDLRDQKGTSDPTVCNPYNQSSRFETTDRNRIPKFKRLPSSQFTSRYLELVPHIYVLLVERVPWPPSDD